MGNGRKTVYNTISTEEKLKNINPDNIQLGNDFLEYLTSIDRSKSTINAYWNDLNVFWCWNLDFNKNKFFIDLTKKGNCKISKSLYECVGLESGKST